MDTQYVNSLPNIFLPFSTEDSEAPEYPLSASINVSGVSQYIFVGVTD
jgi:hypothetical protein